MRDAEIVTLGSMTSWLSGGTPDRSNEEYWSGSVPWISASTLKDLEIYDSPQRVTAAAVRAGSKMAPIGATLILVRGMALHRELRAGIVTRPVCFNQDVKALIPAPAVLPRFLPYAIYAQGRQILDLVSSAGSGTGVLDTSLLKRIRIWLPSRRRQAEIVAILDDVERHLATIDRLITKKQAIKQGMMQQLLTGRTRLPGFTGSWSSTSLGDISAFITKGATPTTYGFKWESIGVPFLRSECVSEQGLDMAQSMFISAAANQTLRRSQVTDGDILMTITGNVGRVIRLAGIDDANINQHIARVRIKDQRFDRDFVYHYLSQRTMRAYYESIVTGQAYPQISLKQVRDAEIPAPDIEEQRAIARALDDADSEIVTLTSRLEKAQAIKQGMMQQLLTGRTRLAAQETAS